MLRSQVMPSLLTWNAIAVFSEEHVAKLVYRVVLLYLIACCPIIHCDSYSD